MEVFTLQNQYLKIAVNAFGAELSSVFSKEYQIEYIWQANEFVWARHAPNLFPIVGKLNKGSYVHQSQEYKLSQHGFARDSSFTCIHQTENSLLFELQSNDETFLNYPFHFKFQVEYVLTATKLETHYKVFNLSENEMYFSVGAHPAFNCPLLPNETFEDYELYFPNKETLALNTLNDGLITEHLKPLVLQENRLPISVDLFDQDALVFMNSQLDEVQLISKVSKHGVKLVSANWPYYGIWSKKNTNHFVCLEPWYGIADKLNFNEEFSKKEGINHLNGLEVFHCNFELSFL